MSDAKLEKSQKMWLEIMLSFCALKNLLLILVFTCSALSSSSPTIERTSLNDGLEEPQEEEPQEEEPHKNWAEHEPASVFCGRIRGQMALHVAFQNVTS